MSLLVVSVCENFCWRLAQGPFLPEFNSDMDELMVELHREVEVALSTRAMDDIWSLDGAFPPPTLCEFVTCCALSSHSPADGYVPVHGRHVSSVVLCHEDSGGWGQNLYQNRWQCGSAFSMVCLHLLLRIPRVAGA